YLAAADAQRAADAAQNVAPGPDVEILLGLRAAAVDDEVRVDLEIRRSIARSELDIGDQVAGAGRRVLRPSHAGLQPRDAALHHPGPAPIELPMVALADAQIAGRGVEVLVVALVTQPHLVVQRHAPRDHAAAGARAFLPIVHVVLLEGSRRAEAAHAGHPDRLL